MKIKIVKVNEHATNLNQISQKVNVQFAYALREGNVIKQTQAFAHCRDYLGDFIWCDKYKKQISIYGMDINPTVSYVSENATELLLKFGKTELRLFPENIKLLHDIEDLNSLEHTQIKHITKNIYYVKGEKFWTSSIFNISLYSYLLKLCAMDKPFEQFNLSSAFLNESYYFSRVSKKWDFIITKLKEIRENTTGISGWDNEETLNSGVLHGNCGFVSLASQIYKHNSISRFITLNEEIK